MLHWSSWWSHSTRAGEAPSAPSPSDPEPWDHENAVRLQTRFWEQWFDAQRSWWTTYTGILPTMAGRTAAPAKPDEGSKQPTEGEAEPSRHHHSPGVERKWPVASGPAGAKLKQQRRRAGLKPKEGPSHH